MGLDVVLQDEHGERIALVEDPHNLLHQMLPAATDTSFQILRFIDWYCDTTLNTRQVKVFLAEWERVTPLNDSPTVREESVRLLESIRYLAERAAAEPHLYLKFIGD
jgi:hypothetical protein